MRPSVVSVGLLLIWTLTAQAQTAIKPAPAPTVNGQMLSQYCVGCHNDDTQMAGFDLTKLDLNRVAKDAPQWEKVVRKMRAGMMPPAGMPRPDKGTMQTFTVALETSLDRVAIEKPNPGRKPIHRLNRAEYANSVRDLIGIEVDAAALLPPDDSTNGFDNIAEVLSVSPALMEGYVRAASKISRMAVGDKEMNPIVESFTLPQGFSQLKHVDGTPVGTRGGMAFSHYFPLDAEYVFKINFYHLSTGPLFGQSTPGEKLEVAINGERVALLDINPNLKINEDVRTPPIKIKAGPQWVSAAFIQRAAGPIQDFHTPFEYALSDLTTGSILGFTGLPHLKTLGISGPFNVTGPGDTPARQHVFVCQPASASDEGPCAKKIIQSLARQAFRRPVNDSDVKTLMDLYQVGRSKGDFDSGIRMAVQAILADPEFVFRFERKPSNVAAGKNYKLTDVELASRLSYFIWSSAPDAELLALAEEGKLSQPANLDKQVRRMLGDPRSRSLAENFAGQWLFLRNLKAVQPDNYIFIDFDTNLKDSMLRETELFFDSIVREDRNVIELLNANYTFVNERLAKHYNIPNVKGDRFRRVLLPDPNRWGLLGHGSILTLTSLSNRTSPVQRGKWVMENILGVHAPTPPPNVPLLKEDQHNEKLLSVRQRLESHRENPSCAACHQMMDPIGFSLDNFDAVGAWRVTDNGFKIDASGKLVDGTAINGPSSLREALVAQSDTFRGTLAEKLLTYALGRGLDYYDMPVVRSVVREAGRNENRFSAFVAGIVKSSPFQMRRAEDNQTVETGAAKAEKPAAEAVRPAGKPQRQ